MRVVSSVVLCVLVLLGAAAPVLAVPAIPSFEPDGGPWGSLVPGVIDDDGKPGPTDGDTPVWPLWLGDHTHIQLMLGPCGPAALGAASTGGKGTGVLDKFALFGDPDTGQPQLDFTGAGGPTHADFYEHNMMAGDLDLMDFNGNGKFEALHAGGPIGMSFPFHFADTNGDGLPDFVSLGSLFGFLADCPPYETTQAIWIPLTNVPGGRGVALDLDGNGDPDPEFLVGPALDIGSSIPTLGRTTLMGLILVLAVLALQRLRATA